MFIAVSLGNLFLIPAGMNFTELSLVLAFQILISLVSTFDPFECKTFSKTVVGLETTSESEKQQGKLIEACVLTNMFELISYQLEIHRSN